jgi:hypothetical protein
MHRLMQRRQRLGAQERRGKELVLGWGLDPLTCEAEGDATVDDESGHLDSPRYLVEARASPKEVCRGSAVIAVVSTEVGAANVRVTNVTGVWRAYDPANAKAPV